MFTDNNPITSARNKFVSIKQTSLSITNDIRWLSYHRSIHAVKELWTINIHLQLGWFWFNCCLLTWLFDAIKLPTMTNLNLVPGYNESTFLRVDINDLTDFHSATFANNFCISPYKRLTAACAIRVQLMTCRATTRPKTRQRDVSRAEHVGAAATAACRPLSVRLTSAADLGTTDGPSSSSRQSSCMVEASTLDLRNDEPEGVRLKWPEAVECNCGTGVWTARVGGGGC
ncbi:hypothetical protein AGLY_013739 [Aphis glycines]|uniref:Uncharacterized protein n=1 Tax=Aphis glycines TaxID=307491 RepID=A0A6G0T4X4_APHGL|nr:hypothetical protein AGLY_013739 [Aphis glycines]